MCALGSRQVRPEARRVLEEGTRPSVRPQAPSRNYLLAELPAEDFGRLLSHLEPVVLPQGWPVHEGGDREKYLYFLTAGIVSRYALLESGSTVEYATTGDEGVIGIASFLGGQSTPNHAHVLCAGQAYRLGASRLMEEFERGGALPQLLLRYTQALLTQTGQVAICNRYHALEQRLCRWLMTCLDRVPGSELTLTQDLVAAMLGVRRESISEVVGKLERTGVLHCTRGHIGVLDRAGLETQACECYAVVKREYERLLPGCLQYADKAYRSPELALFDGTGAGSFATRERAIA